MAEQRAYLAVDLGAESGRVMRGVLSDGCLELAELHRFANGPLQEPDGMHWDVQRLWREIKAGLGLAARLDGSPPGSIGLDTWGVDFGLLDASGSLLGNPFHYRDSRTNGKMEQAFAIVPREAIYRQTGNQFMQLNTLFQLFSMRGQAALQQAERLLFMPDLFNYWLSGVQANEYTISTTSQCLNPVSGMWAAGLLEQLGIPARIFGQITPPGRVLGSLRDEVQAETGCPGLPVVAVGSHDTASAVAGVPAWTTDFIYISSGTWSLMGVESPAPIINERSLAYNITNEGGVYGTTRLLKNIMGMWLLQECRREWAEAGHKYSYDELTALAERAPAFGPHVQPNESRFLSPGPMAGRIRQACADGRQPVPHSEGEIARCILESLALEYRRVTRELETLTGRTASAIHIVGGGSRNRLLNQLTADCTGKLVVAGPVEATAAGNMLVQAVALGHLRDLKEARQVIHQSFTPQVYEPRLSTRWEEAFAAYEKRAVV